MLMLDPNTKGAKNPWADQTWNITRQGLFVREYGVETAQKWALAAGTEVGGPRPRHAIAKAGPPGPRGKPGLEGDAGAQGTADEPAQEITTSGNTLTIVRSNGKHVRVLLESDIDTIVITGWPAANIRGAVTLEIYNMASWTLTGWPAGTMWSGNTEPTPSANGVDTYVLFSSDGGNTILASVAFMSA